MMQTKLSKLFIVLSLLASLVGSTEAMAVTSATIYKITVQNLDPDSFDPTINTWSGYYGDHPPQHLGSNSSDSFTYNSTATPSTTEQASGAYSGPSVIYKNSDLTWGCEFDFTWDENTGCKIDAKDWAPPSKSRKAPGPWCTATMAAPYDESTTTCTILFTIY